MDTIVRIIFFSDYRIHNFSKLHTQSWNLKAVIVANPLIDAIGHKISVKVMHESYKAAVTALENMMVCEKGRWVNSELTLLKSQAKSSTYVAAAIQCYICFPNNMTNVISELRGLDWYMFSIFFNVLGALDVEKKR